MTPSALSSLARAVAASAIGAAVSVAAGSAGAAPAPSQPAGPLQSLTVPLKGGDIVMMAPAGATAKASFGTTFDITAGRAFQIELGLRPTATIARTKQEIEKNSLNILQRYLVDEPTAIVYQSAVGGASEHHIYVVIPDVLGGLVCEDTKGPVYTEAQARAMYAACKSVTLKR